MIESGALEQAFASLEVSRPPSAPTVALVAPPAAGNVDNGDHYYKISFVTATGETLPGTASAVVTVADKEVNGKVNVTAIPVGPAGCTDRKVYRTKAGGSAYFVVAAIGDNTTTAYEDNIADAALTVAAPVRSTAYATLAQPVAGDGLRHNELQLTGKLNREPSAQKRATPDVAQSLPRRKSAGWSLSALWEPSGTLGTPSYLGRLLKAAFGTQTLPALDTTVAAGGSTTGATLIAVGSLAVGDCIVLTMGAAARREITRVKTLPGGMAITYDAISAAPDTPGAAVSGVTYKFASTILDTLTLCLFHTGGGFQQAVTGCIVDKVEFLFDGTKEVQIRMSGPGRELTRTGFTLPATHTTVGSPASGMVGDFHITDTPFPISQATVAFENAEAQRNTEIGTAYASGHMRGGRRKVTVSCSYYLEDTTVLAAAESVTTQTLRLLIGQTNGSMVGIVAPTVEWEIPDIPTTDGPKIISSSGVAYASASGNDALFAAEA